MTASIHDFLQPQVMLDIVSRIRKSPHRLSRWLGMQFTGYDSDLTALTGPSVHVSPTRYGSYQIFDRTRTVAQMRSPDSGPATWLEQPVGFVNYSVCRMHEKIRLSAEKLMNLAKIGGPNTILDPGGQNYMSRQLGYQAERFANTIDMMLGGVLRGTWYVKNQGDDWFPTYTQPAATVPYVTINQQVPAGNQGQLDMLGAGPIIVKSWDDPTAKIISNDLPKMVEANAQLTGYATTDAFTTPTVWGKIITNTEVTNTSGSANQPFDTWKFEGPTPDGAPFNEYVAVLRGYPMIKWHIISEYLVMDNGTDPSYAAGTGTLTSLIPPNQVIFTPPPDPEWLDMITYEEYVVEAPGMPMVKRPNPWFWAEWRTQPGCVELLGLLNCIPRLRIPKALVTPTVIF